MTMKNIVHSPKTDMINAGVKPLDGVLTILISLHTTGNQMR